MKLTGKCKEDFEKWLKENNKDLLKLSDPSIYFSEIFSMSALFKYLTESMQYGVLEDFFDNAGIGICVTPVFPTKKYGWSFSVELEASYSNYLSRNRARTAAIEKANELYNL
jgi:hypothetical protein